MKQKKTNAVRLLEQQHISYELKPYAVDESDLSAPSVAAKVGMAPQQVFKTLVARGDKMVCFWLALPPRRNWT